MAVLEIVVIQARTIFANVSFTIAITPRRYVVKRRTRFVPVR